MQSLGFSGNLQELQQIALSTPNEELMQIVNQQQSFQNQIMMEEQFLRQMMQQATDPQDIQALLYQQM